MSLGSLSSLALHLWDELFGREPLDVAQGSRQDLGRAGAGEQGEPRVQGGRAQVVKRVWLFFLLLTPGMDFTFFSKDLIQSCWAKLSLTDLKAYPHPSPPQ